VFFGSIQPVVCNEGANDNALQGGKNNLSLLGFGFADLPSVTSCLYSDVSVALLFTLISNALC
jgi:hypothetical protein